MPLLIYIASAYRIGDVADNVAVSMNAGHLIMDMGHAPIVPLLTHFMHIHRRRAYQDWMAVDFIVIPRCDALVRLEGESKGADQEVQLAIDNDIPVLYGLQNLVTWLQKLESVNLERDLRMEVGHGE